LIQDAFNTEVLLSCMEKLRSGQPVNIPSYDFKIHQSIESSSPVLLVFACRDSENTISYWLATLITMSYFRLILVM